jgi:tetratricopeptide (TPR) repeat protein
MNDLQRLLMPVLGYIDLGMFEDAWEELETLPPELRANGAVLDLRITIYHRLGKWESARMLAESLAKKFPENPHWWIQWAYSARREKSVYAARSVLMEAATRHPDVALIPYSLACYSCEEGSIETAKNLLTTAFAMDPKLRKIALDDPDLEPIYGKNSPGTAPTFDPPHPPPSGQP